MDFGFKPLTYETSCTPRDEAEGPAILELTPIGDLVIHNWDREVDEAEAALGFGRSQCLMLMSDWWKALSSAFFHHSQGALPLSFFNEIKKVAKRTIHIAGVAFKDASYHPAQFQFRLLGIYKNRFEAVFSKEVVHPAVGGFQSRNLLTLETTLEAYFELLEHVEHGFIYDRKDEQFIMAAAIVGWVNENLMFVKAGKTVPSDPGDTFFTKVVSRDVLIERGEGNEWLVKQWVEP